MRAIAVHEDVLVFVSAIWQTTCTAIRSGGEGFLIDSPVLPDELDALPGVLEQAGFAVSGLLATHGDWDHLLGRLAFAQATLGCGESTAARLAAEPGAAQRSLRDFDGEHYVVRDVPLSLGAVQSLPVPGRVELGPDRELELHRTGGHTADGIALWAPWLRVLVCGDYLSPVEIPMISGGGGIDAYLATLTRLEPLVSGAEAVIPGHGAPLSAAEAQRILGEDLTYLRGLGAGEPPVLPPGRSSARQRQIDAENRRAVG